MRVPSVGAPVEMRLDGRTHHVWWGPDDDGRDCIVTEDGLLRVFTTDADCLQYAQQHGLALDDAYRGEVDLGPAQRWLSNGEPSLDPGAALDVWNWGTDVAYSTGRVFHDRDRDRDLCYEALISGRPPRSATLRDVLAEVLDLTRSAVPRTP